MLLVCGIASRNPSALGQSDALEHDGPRGIFTVTRHPVMWAIALWAIAHVAVNGDASSMILFASLGVLALAGIASQERKKRARLGEAWRRFSERTSVVPFAATLGGRTTLDLAGIGWARAAGESRSISCCCLATQRLSAWPCFRPDGVRFRREQGWPR